MPQRTQDALTHIVHGVFESLLVLTFISLTYFRHSFITNIDAEASGLGVWQERCVESELVGDFLHIGILLTIKHLTKLKRLHADQRWVGIKEVLKLLVEQLLVIV